MRIRIAIAAVVLTSGLLNAQSSPYIDIPGFAREFNSVLSRGWYGVAPCAIKVVGVNVPNEELLTQQNVALFTSSTKPAPFPSVTAATPVWAVAGAPADNVVPVSPPVVIAKGDYLGTIGTCSTGPGLIQSNSYGSPGPFNSMVGGQPMSMLRLITQTNLSSLQTAPMGMVPISTEDTGNISRVQLYVVALGGDDASPKPGGTVNLTCEAGLDAGMPYVLALSLGAGPIQIGTRQINLSADALLLTTIGNLAPGLLVNGQGTLNGDGLATAQFNVPNLPILVGAKVHAGFVTLDVNAPDGISSISETFVMTIS